MLGQRKNIRQIQWRAGNEDLFLLQLQMLTQISDELAVRLPIHLQADRRETAALFQDLLHLLAVILILIIHAGIQVDVRVARDRNDHGHLHLIAGEQLFNIGGNDILQQDEPQRVFLGHRKGARQRIRDRNEPVELLLLRGQPDHHIQLLVGHMRERMMDIDDLRRKDRQHPVQEISAHPLFFLSGKMGKAHPVDQRLELIAHILINGIAKQIQLLRLPIDGLQLLLRVHPGFIVNMLFIQDGQVIQAAAADHVKLIEVAGKDRDELQPLQQRHIAVSRFLQHAFVEFQPGQLAVLRIFVAVCHGSSSFSH